jgi:ribosome-binding protein aMBF1 (putative translation factor)
VAEKALASGLARLGKRRPKVDEEGHRKRQTPKAHKFQERNAATWAEAKKQGHTQQTRLRASLKRRLRWRDFAVSAGYEQLVRELGKRGMSADDLARALEVTDKHLSAVLTGRLPLSPALHGQIAKYMDLADSSLPEPVTGRGHRHWHERDWAKPTVPTLAEVRVWEKECSAAMACTTKDIHGAWLDELKTRGVRLIGPPPLLSEPERKKRVVKALRILRRARQTKNAGQLPRGTMSDIAWALYGSRAAGDIDVAEKWCKKQPELEALLKPPSRQRPEQPELLSFSFPANR